MIKTKPLLTPQLAEATFYLAFEKQDIALMMSVWADDDSITCIHPGGPRLEGKAAVMASWQEIFSHKPPLQFAISNIRLVKISGLSVHIIQENIFMASETRGIVIATNVYRNIGRKWRMILHHASPGSASQSSVQTTLH